MTFDAIANRGEYLSAYYLAEVLPRDLKKKDEGLLARWGKEETDGRSTPRVGIRALRRDYLDAKTDLADLGDAEKRRAILHDLHTTVLTRLGYLEPGSTHREPQSITMERAGREHEVVVAHAEPGIAVIECGWATDPDEVVDPGEDAGRLRYPVELDRRERIEGGFALAGWLFGAEQQPPRYVLILCGGVLVLTDRLTWGEGRYLAAGLDAAYARNDTRAAGELDVIAALFSADALRPPPEGGAEPLAGLVAGSRQNAVGVSTELREGIRSSVEHIANEVLARIAQAGVRPEALMDATDLGRSLAKEALRYLYRILFLLYAEARPDLGVLPVDYPEYMEGYSLTRLGDLVTRPLVGEAAANGFHLYESLDLLFHKVNGGYHERGGTEVTDGTSEGEGIRFEPLQSNLFLDGTIKHIGPKAFIHPDDDPDEPDARTIDTRLRNATLHTVLRLLMLTRGSKKQRGGFISYAQLGINQLGAVYEGLMSYTGFIADEELYEVAKGGDASDGSWMIRASAVDAFPDEVFVTRSDEETGRRDRVRYPAGSFVYRLAGRDRQTSASYYTPPSLTEVTVNLALKQLIKERPPQRAQDLLTWTICEPALGSGAFLNEAINQVAAEYLRRAQEETGKSLDPEQYAIELQKTKAYIALHNCYGVDLNPMAVELADVSIWLNVMHAGLQAPWFGLHLRHGNSLIGAGRRTYPKKALAKRAWLTTAPEDRPFRDGQLPDDEIHHFLLPADGWGAVAKEKEARTWAPDDAARLRDWRRGILHQPGTKGSPSQLRRLQNLAGRVELFWDLVRQRIKLSEDMVRRHIDVWGATGLPDADDSAPREEILAALEAIGAPYWRLKTLMNAWCALWFWPLDRVGLLDGSAPEYEQAATSVSRIEERVVLEDPPAFTGWGDDGLFSLADLGQPEQLTIAAPTQPSNKKISKERITVRLARKVPLASLDDWLAFCEALLGTSDIPADSFVATFHDLETLEQYEEELLRWTGMEPPTRIAERFPWVSTVEEIADQQGFFHWELQFAQVFANGGFDLQVGNPPWVRPDWDDDAILAENDPWFKLAKDRTLEERERRKSRVLGAHAQRLEYLAFLASSSATSSFLGSISSYPLLAGTQPDLYRAFMCQAWVNSGQIGVSALIHQDSHLTGVREGVFRSATYRHLRLHAHFINRRLIFADVDWNRPFSINVYGPPRDSIGFYHLCWLFDPGVLIPSLDHDGSGDVPGLKFKGVWDLRPHRKRVIQVDIEVLRNWQHITGDPAQDVSQTKLLYPVSSLEQAAISALATRGTRLGALSPSITSGFHESGAKRDGLMRSETRQSTRWDEVVLRGPQIAISNPFAKQPPRTLHTDKAVDLATITDDAVPSTDYVMARGARSISSRDHWIDQSRLGDLSSSVAARRHAVFELRGKNSVEPTETAILDYFRSAASRPYSDFYRVAWREMIPASTERSLFPALIPPGPTHVDAVRSMALRDNRATVLVVGFWSSLLLDYALRVSGRSHLKSTDAKMLPAPESGHPLSSALLLRTLRLNCVTSNYAPVWSELFDNSWSDDESWAVKWVGLPPLQKVGPTWDRATLLRSERERRAALVEMDALVAVWLGVGADELVSIYLSRFPQLVDYETQMWFDANGRKIAGNFNQYGTGQTKEHFVQLMAHLEDPAQAPPPEGYSAPFFKADRPTEMRQAHAVFSGRLQAAKDAGWRP